MMELIKSKSEKQKKVNISKKPQEKREIDWDDITREEMIKIIEYYIERDKKENRKKQNLKDSQKLDIRLKNKAKIFGFSKSGYFKNKNRKEDKSLKDLELKIISIYKEECKNYGRVRFSKHLLENHGIEINYRTLGRKMNKWNLKRLN